MEFFTITLLFYESNGYTSFLKTKYKMIAPAMNGHPAITTMNKQIGVKMMPIGPAMANPIPALISSRMAVSNRKNFHTGNAWLTAPTNPHPVFSECYYQCQHGRSG